MQAFELRGAGAVIHSHSLSALAATLLDQDSSEFSVTHIEMIKVGIVCMMKCSVVGKESQHSCSKALYMIEK